MSNIVVYDPDDTVVAGRVLEYAESANTPDYNSESNKIISPDLSGVSGVDQKYWKVDTGAVVEMTAQEKADVDDNLPPSGVANKNYQVEEYSATTHRILKDTWYERDNGGGSYSVMAEETTYNYTGNNLDTKVTKTYSRDGSVVSTETWTYYKDGNKVIAKKS